MFDVWKIILTAIVASIFSGIIAPCIIYLLQYRFQPEQEKNSTMTTQRWLDKKEIFEKSIDLAQKNFIAGSINGPGGKEHEPTGNYPTTDEKNYILSRLYVLSDNENIPEAFIKLFTEPASAKDIADYILMTRKDLYGDIGGFNSDKMGVVFSNKSQ